MLDTIPIARELSFLARQTGQDELTLLTRAMQLGLNMLYSQAVEQSFVDGEITREEAIAILSQPRVEEIEYAKQALTQDIVRGYSR
ncbi:MAG: hypothetical protein KGJ80_13180 [Chloroflexota bacterium]|nr:hypothetical protein [Chloroflexota bacterium]